jgi:hypothetical protein
MCLSYCDCDVSLHVSLRLLEAACDIAHIEICRCRLDEKLLFVM